MKSLKHTFLQRMRLIHHLAKGGAVATLDASAWDEHHTADELNLTVQVIVEMVKVFDIAVGAELAKDMDSVEFVTEPDVLIILQAEITYHKHVSTRAMFSIVSFVLDEGQSSTRGWTGGITKTFGLVSPAVKELQNWSQDRVEELVALQAEDKLEAPLPREWERMIHHSYFKTDQIPIAVRSIASHQACSSVPRAWWGGTTCGADMAIEVPFSRWNHEEFYDPTPDCWMESQMYPGGFLKTNVKHVQFIEGVELFDNKFFGLSNMEAGGMDPMQRHIMETSYESLFNV
ncbi:pikAI [Symbiodinium natans]|uniref:PikAI protein n=1 Tax=Symbiodinium natans TaxID=878477 RepID=A0A812S386_9DINO|nr:pikAI [Symbiodinium natans]